MLFPILISIGLPLFLAPVFTNEIFTRSFAWQKAQIELDNSAISLGKADRDLFNQLRAINRTIQVLEIPHHVAHLCVESGNPYTEVVCAEEDALLESQIAYWHNTAWFTASLYWRKNSAQAHFSVFSLDTLGQVERESRVPIKSIRCSLCLMETEWEISNNPVISKFKISKPREIYVAVKFNERSLRQGDRWNYVLNAREGE